VKDRAVAHWAEEGWVEITPGPVIDHEVVKARILEAASVYHIVELGFDPWNATQIALDLERQGLPMVKVRQGHGSLGEGTKKMADLVVLGLFNHLGNPVLAWNAKNARGRTDVNANICPDKKRSREKIDGVVASIIAISRAIAQPGKRELTGEVAFAG
jgi:phage terminase large subunit-like protein